MSKIDWYFRSNLKFRHLQLLITLDELRHIGKTAEHLNISQPAVSKALAAFEEGLNIELFERTTRGMKPTEAGECLIRYARLMLNEMVNVRNELIDINEGRVTRISLGILPIASLCILPNFIALLESEMIATSITVREGTTDLLLSMLRANELDFVICNLTGKPLGIEFTSLPLYKDSIAVAVRRNHPLVTNEKISWQDLSGYSMILPPEFATTRFAIEEYLIYRGVDLAHRYAEDDFTIYILDELNRVEIYCHCDGSKDDYIREISSFYASSQDKFAYDPKFVNFNLPQFYKIVTVNNSRCVVPYISSETTYHSTTPSTLKEVGGDENND